MASPRPIDTETAARELARSLVADLVLLDGGPADVAEARTLYQSRVIGSFHSFFETALAQEQARRLLRGPRAGSGRPVVAIMLIVAVATAYFGWRMAAADGDVAGDLAIPGSLELTAEAGDQLAFTLDTEVLFQSQQEDDTPGACIFAVKLEQAGREVASASCDAFTTRGGISIAASTGASIDDATGLMHLTTTGQRVSCSLAVPAAGPVTLRASSNLDTCVPKAMGAVAHVFRTSKGR